MLQNPELHYLDNAATTMVAPEVADVIDKVLYLLRQREQQSGSAGRGAHPHLWQGHRGVRL